MQRQSPNPSHAAEDLKDLAAFSWADFDLEREIQLLELAVHRDKVDARIDALLAQKERLDRIKFEGADTFSLSENEQRELQCNIEEDLRQSFLDYALSVVLERALPDIRDHLRGSCERLRSRYGLGFYLAGIYTLGLAAICRLVASAESCAVAALRLKKIAATACDRTPLFSYGPELCWFRHRLRLTLA